jgi:hypothetical protein
LDDGNDVDINGLGKVLDTTTDSAEESLGYYTLKNINHGLIKVLKIIK